MNDWRFFIATIVAGMILPVHSGVSQAEGRHPLAVEVGTYDAELRTVYSTEDGLPSNDVTAMAVTGDGKVYAGTSKGLALLEEDAWKRVANADGVTQIVAANGNGLLFSQDRELYQLQGEKTIKLASLPSEVSDLNALRNLVSGNQVLLATSQGLFQLRNETFIPVQTLNRLLGDDTDVRQVAIDGNGRAAVAAEAGLFLSNAPGAWKQLEPRAGTKSWSPRDVRGIAFDNRGGLWFASAQGVGCLDPSGSWSLYTGHEGLPYSDFTTAAAGGDEAVWFGTRMGAIRFDGRRWSYRRGRMWLPDDQVRSIAVSQEGDAWFATPEGAGVIDRQPKTLAEKAQFFEEEIDKYHRRTEYGYVLSVSLKNPGDKSEFTQHDSDNDGLWTSMYGAGECFAYAATKDEKAKERAKAAFEAVRFLSQVTQGGSHPAPPGFPARTILPASAGDPNAENYTPEKDVEKQTEDPFWKVITPRWPLSEDGKWYWKTDTSSDELDGHYFLYATYYDLVADTEQEKQRVRDVVTAITDHLIDHDFQLVDHDGKPTRWARYTPELLNGGELWVERGLNSLSMLSYLKVAEHMSGDPKYRDVYDRLINEHSYHINALEAKFHNGPGSGNQSDDEMAFMCYYNLFKYEDDPELREIYNRSLRKYWGLVSAEMNPLFNFIFAASYDGTKNEYWEGLGIPASEIPQWCITDAADCLKGYAYERIFWGYKNSHRTDVVPLPDFIMESEGRGIRRNGKVVPIDERFVEHWNHSPWTLDANGDGTRMADGSSFLLPYYMGLYHGFIVEEEQ